MGRQDVKYVILEKKEIPFVIILAKCIMLIMDLIVILTEWFIFRTANDVISTTLEAQSILLEKNLTKVTMYLNQLEIYNGNLVASFYTYFRLKCSLKIYRAEILDVK